MQGRSGTRAGLVYLLAGAALGAAVVLVLWIYSGGKPFGEVVGSTAVSSPTPAAVQPSAPQERAGAPASAARLESEPPAIGRSRELRFIKKERAAKAVQAKAKKAKKKPRRKPVVRVVAPPPSTEADDEEELPVAVVPSPAPTASPAPPAPAPAGGGGKPVKQAPSSGVGAGEG